MIHEQPCSIPSSINEWLPYNSPTIVHFESMKRISRGHPKSTCILNEMDVREGKTIITCRCANNLVTIVALVKIGIKLIETCMFFVVKLP